MAGKFERLNGQISGEGEVTVVLGHGFGTDQTAWAGLRPWLDDKFRVVSFDLAGAGPDGGANYEPRRYQSLFGYADDLLEVIAELRLERCVYIGHSVSGMIGAAAAVARPQAFSRLMMIGASPRYLNAPGYHGGFEQEDLDGLYDGMSLNFQAWAAGFAPLVVGVPDHAAVHEFSRMLFLMRPDVALATARVIFQSDMRDIVPRLERPVHIVQPRSDMAVPMEVAKFLHARLDRSTLDIIETVGHLPHLTAPAQIIAMFERHLRPLLAMA